VSFIQKVDPTGSSKTKAIPWSAGRSRPLVAPLMQIAGEDEYGSAAFVVEPDDLALFDHVINPALEDSAAS
jgi:hypothetical protein